MSLLNLERPLIVFDLETTGTSVGKDRIVEIAAIKVFENGNEAGFTSLVNPEVPIPEGASKIHGIWDEDVKKAPTFAELAPEIFDFFYNCDYCGYNVVRFDVPMLQSEFDRCGTPLNLEAGHIVDVMRIFKHFERHRLQDAVRFYCGHEIEDAHEAMADVEATLDVLRAQVKRYDLPKTAREITEGLRPEGALDAEGKIREVDGVPILTFGKHKGLPVKDAPKSYLIWLRDESVVPDCKELLDTLIKTPRRKLKKSPGE